MVIRILYFNILPGVKSGLFFSKKYILHYNICINKKRKRVGVLKCGTFKSDYSDAILKVVQTDDGDIILKILHPGEMRIATQGGKLHGDDLVSVVASFSNIIDILAKNDRG